jgi:serine/threonine protein kinase
MSEAINKNTVTYWAHMFAGLKPPQGYKPTTVTKIASLARLASPAPLGTACNKRFELLEILGEGGFGVVYLARDTHTGKYVAVKTSNPDSPIPQSMIVKSFELEEKNLRGVGNGSLIGKIPAVIHGVTKEKDSKGKDRVVIVTEFLEGKTLANLLDVLHFRDEVINLGSHFVTGYAITILTIIATMLRIQASFEKRGKVNRDFSTDNTIVNGTVRQSVDRQGRPVEEVEVSCRVFDLGTMMPAGEQEQVMGKIAYMAPEHMAGRAVDSRADQFALGVLGYELFSGKAPFCHNAQYWGNTQEEVYYRARVEKLTNNCLGLEKNEQLTLGLPLGNRELEGSILRAFRRMATNKPEDRFPSGQAAQGVILNLVRGCQAWAKIPDVELSISGEDEGVTHGKIKMSENELDTAKTTMMSLNALRKHEEHMRAQAAAPGFGEGVCVKRQILIKG